MKKTIVLFVTMCVLCGLVACGTENSFENAEKTLGKQQNQVGTSDTNQSVNKQTTSSKDADSSSSRQEASNNASNEFSNITPASIEIELFGVKIVLGKTKLSDIAHILMPEDENEFPFSTYKKAYEKEFFASGKRLTYEVSKKFFGDKVEYEDYFNGSNPEIEISIINPDKNTIIPIGDGIIGEIDIFFTDYELDVRLNEDSVSPNLMFSDIEKKYGIRSRGNDEDGVVVYENENEDFYFGFEKAESDCDNVRRFFAVISDYSVILPDATQIYSDYIASLQPQTAVQNKNFESDTMREVKVWNNVYKLPVKLSTFLDTPYLLLEKLPSYDLIRYEVIDDAMFLSAGATCRCDVKLVASEDASYDFDIVVKNLDTVAKPIFDCDVVEVVFQYTDYDWEDFTELGYSPFELAVNVDTWELETVLGALDSTNAQKEENIYGAKYIYGNQQYIDITKMGWLTVTIHFEE